MCICARAGYLCEGYVLGCICVLNDHSCSIGYISQPSYIRDREMASLGHVLVDQTSIGIIEIDHIMIKLQFYANAPIKHFGGEGVHARGVQKPMLDIALSYTFPIPHVPT